MKKKPDEFRGIGHVETSLFDIFRDGEHVDAKNPGVRLFCTASPAMHGEHASWALQVRAKVKTKTKREGKHFAIGTASMSREDLAWLRDLIDAEIGTRGSPAGRQPNVNQRRPRIKRKPTTVQSSGVAGYSNYGGGGAFAPMAGPAPESRTIMTSRNFSPKMQHVLRIVGAKSYPTHASDRTIRSLERLGVVEHTSIGWRLTGSGIRWVRHLP